MKRGGPVKRGGKSASSPWKCAACGALGGHGTAGQNLLKGRQALTKAHQDLVEGDIECSLDFDTTFKSKYPNNHRVDYLFVRKDDCAVVAVEVHPASSTGNVEEVIKKKEETEKLLVREGLGVSVKDWHWAVGGQSTVVFTAQDKYGLKLAAKGIQQPRRKVQLGK